MRYLAMVGIFLFGLSATAEEPVRLWTGETYPTLAQLERAKGVRFSTIKRHEPEKDGFDWLHGVGLCWHGNRLYASYGTNPGKENTAGESCMCRYSDDDGETWSEPQLIDAGEPSVGLSVSHGVFLSSNGRLYSFMGSFNSMTVDGKWARNSMVLAMSTPGEWAYSQVRLVRSTDDLAPDAQGRKAYMSYPAAVERNGKLYIGYSVGFADNRNSAELAVVPLR